MPFIASKLPRTSQIIVTFEGDVSESFLRQENRAFAATGGLQEDQFATIANSLGGLIELMQNDLLSP
jgi:hypothetical protein